MVNETSISSSSKKESPINFFFLSILFWTIVTTYIILLFVGPRIPNDKQKDYCVRNFEINKTFGHSMNCDSADWILNSSNPSRLLEKESVRQTRPGLVIMTYILSHPINFLLNKSFDLKDYPKITVVKDKFHNDLIIYEKFNPKVVYLSYFIINLIILITSINFFFKLFNLSIFKIKSYGNLIAWLSLILLINNTVNQFLYSPSTKFFNIFCCLFSIFYSVQILRNNIDLTGRYYLFTITGLLTLFYPVFFISFVTFLIFLLVNYLKENIKTPLIFEIALLIFLFIFPFLSWYTIVIIRNDEFFISNFSEYKFIIWIFDAYKESGFLKTIKIISNDFLVFFKILFLEYWFMIILLFPFITIYKRIHFRIKDETFLSSVFFIVIYSFFYVILGHKPIDIISVLVIPFFVILGKFLELNHKYCQNYKELCFFYFVFFFPYYCWSVTKFGPYS